MKEIHTTIDIDATAERVWKHLTDFQQYPRWNPFIIEIDGELRPGARLRVHLRPPGTRGMVFRPEVRIVEPGRELRWKGSLLVRGMFDGEHIFRIEPRDQGGVTFIQSEKFSGLLVPLFAHSIATDTRKGFEEMNLALRQIAEAPQDQ